MGTLRSTSPCPVDGRPRLSSIVLGEIRAEMGRQGRTQTWLANELEITEAYLSRRFRGEVSISLDDVEQIAGALGCDPVGFVVVPQRIVRAAS